MKTKKNQLSRKGLEALLDEGEELADEVDYIERIVPVPVAVPAMDIDDARAEFDAAIAARAFHQPYEGFIY